MEVTFDPAKNGRNIRERGLSFQRAADFDFETALVLEDTRHDYGEIRYRALGKIDEDLHSLVFTLREGEPLRVISLRRANRRERKSYEEAVKS
ncbi:MAG: BrnT family toxin [Acidobacteriaceae bacterium]